MIPKISVIVPVYNGEHYLRECMDSLIQQTLSEIEILAINNGSTDRSGEILDEYAKKDKRIKILTLHPNKGPGGGRNAGLDAAAGEYIAFCDCDDTVPPDAYRLLYEKAKEESVDVVVGDSTENADGKLTYRDVCNAQPNAYVICSWGALWNKLYLREFIERHHIRVPLYIGDEDLLFLGYVIKNKPSYALVHQSIYTWYTHPENVTSQTKIMSSAVLHDNVEVRLQYNQIRTDLGYMSATASSYESFYYLLQKWCAMNDGMEKSKAFQYLQEYVKLSPWNGIETVFAEICGMSPGAFVDSNYDTFVCAFDINAFQVLWCGKEPYRNEVIQSLEAKNEGIPTQDETLVLFREGKVGFRYLFRYLRGWVSYKIKALFRTE